MNNILDQIFGVILISLALGIGMYAWTQSTVLSVKTAAKFHNIESTISESKNNLKPIVNRIEGIEESIKNIASLSDKDKKTLEIDQKLSQLNESYENVSRLMGIIQDDPEKIIEVKTLKIKQESNYQVLSVKIESESNVLNQKIESLNSKLDQASFYNNILISIVVLMLGVVWKQHRSAYNKSNQSDAQKARTSV